MMGITLNSEELNQQEANIFIHISYIDLWSNMRKNIIWTNDDRAC